MSKKRPKPPTSAPPSLPTQKELEKRAAAARRNVRETIESVAIAFILAFLFRTFEAEAFVIPTGSMAPTLQGEHKDLECIKCGYRFQVNASSESENGGRKVVSDIVAGTCPQCRYTVSLDPTGRNVDDRDEEEIMYGMEQKTYSGDRILVGKFVYDFVEPERWDVIVFKYPGDTKMNYIKRLIGLPGEEITIHHGDIYVRKNGSQDPRKIARKHPLKQLAMMQTVHDNAYTSSELVQKGWPRRWHSFSSADVKPEKDWQEAPFTAADLENLHVQPVYSIAAGSEVDCWLRYQHFVPGWEDWLEMAEGPLGANYPFRPQLITDFYAYNTALEEGQRRGTMEPPTRMLGMHWVADLMLQTTVEVQSSSGELLLDLVKGGYHFTCRIDVQSGKARLESSAEPLKDFHAEGETPIRGPGTYELKFSNVDHQLRLWVNDELVDFGENDGMYDLEVDRPQSTPLDAGDLAPAGIGSRGVALRVPHLQIWRDIYYISTSHQILNGGIDDFDAEPGLGRLADLTPEEYAEFLSTPSHWQIYTRRRTVSFTLSTNPHDPGRDQFFMLGDNSPSSKDSRLWPDGDELKHYVERQLLIGKALCIYWPHPWREIPGIRFPYFPNFADMGLVR